MNVHKGCLLQRVPLAASDTRRRKPGPSREGEIGVSETGSAKTGSAIDVRIDDAGSILNFRIGFFLFDSLP